MEPNDAVDHYTVKTTEGKMTIGELYRKYYGTQIGPGASPYEVRERILFLSQRYSVAMLEKTISREMHGNKQVGLWNNISEMLRREMSAVELVNTSLCNERRVVGVST
jgi:hypothetical protein